MKTAAKEKIPISDVQIFFNIVNQYSIMLFCRAKGLTYEENKYNINLNLLNENPENEYAIVRKKVMFCSRCGARLNEGAKFCTQCGKKIASEDTALNYSESKSEKAVNIFFEKLGDFLVRIIEWHKKFLKKNKIAAAALIIIEAALAIWLLFKTWVICLGILIVASIVLPFIMKHDFTEKDRQNSKEIIIGFIALTVFIIILFVILFNWEPVSSIWDH